MWWLFTACSSTSDDSADNRLASPGTADTAADTATEVHTGGPGEDSAPEPASVRLVWASSCVNPCTFSAEVDGDVATLRYEADGWELGTATPEAPEITYTFSELGDRSIRVVALDGGGDELDDDIAVVRVDAPAPVDALGVWLWYIEGTGMDHDALAARLASLGVARIFVKVADGDADCSSWPELCDEAVPRAYQAAGLEAWAWAYVYPGSASDQAHALSLAAATGYDGYVLDIETEFDGATSSLESILDAFASARDDAVADGLVDAGWELRATTWGNPADHGMRVDIIDRYVDAHMPQTYVEAWGSSYMANAADWVQVGTCEYRDLGATGPIHHIVSTEYGDITVAQLGEFVAASGPETSVWRVPGEGTPMSIWDDWEALDWTPGVYAEPDCP